ncbi:hypothetical protein Tco_0119267, partial [Tanacetum coccineum]
LEVAFRKHTCFVRDLDGVDLLKGSRGTNLYTIYVEDMMRSSPIFLLSKASKNKSWLWHRIICVLHANLERAGKLPTNPRRLTPLWKFYTPFTWIYADR